MRRERSEGSERSECSEWLWEIGSGASVGGRSERCEWLRGLGEAGVGECRRALPRAIVSAGSRSGEGDGAESSLGKGEEGEGGGGLEKTDEEQAGEWEHEDTRTRGHETRRDQTKESPRGGVVYRTNTEPGDPSNPSCRAR